MTLDELGYKLSQIHMGSMITCQLNDKDSREIISKDEDGDSFVKFYLNKELTKIAIVEHGYGIFTPANKDAVIAMANLIGEPIEI